MPSEQLQTILQVLRSRPVQQALNFQESRQAFEQMAWFFAAPKDVRSEPVDATGVPGQWISTPESTDGRVIYYLHGGGYPIGPPPPPPRPGPPPPPRRRGRPRPLPLAPLHRRRPHPHRRRRRLRRRRP